MIAYVKGTVEELTTQSVILECAGLGYIINTPTSTLGRLPHKGEMVQLFTHLQVKEDDMSLFGFLNQEDLRLFRLLISISGIGPKVAMSILSMMSPEQILTAIASGDAVAFSKVPGVGKKTASRITLELSDKINVPDTSFANSDVSSSEKQDAIDALLSLGYSRSESLRAVLSVATEDMPTDLIVKHALKKLIS